MQNCTHTSELQAHRPALPLTWVSWLSAGWKLISSDLVKASDAFASWHERAKQRRELMSLSDTMLKDIGVTRAQARGEFEKPFWQE